MTTSSRFPSGTNPVDLDGILIDYEALDRSHCINCLDGFHTDCKVVYPCYDSLGTHYADGLCNCNHWAAIKTAGWVKE